MILYVDTSALVKLYVEEKGSELVRHLVDEAVLVATSRIAYAEARAALARTWREGALSEEDYRQSTIYLRADWQAYFTLDLAESVVQVAGDLAERHRIRGFDAIHLASGLTLSRRVRDPITFVCWDIRLWNAAQEEGFDMVPPELPTQGDN
jgi:predicted nucleic acid-binding protein